MSQTSSDARRTPARRPSSDYTILGRGACVLALLLSVACANYASAPDATRVEHEPAARQLAMERPASDDIAEVDAPTTHDAARTTTSAPAAPPQDRAERFPRISSEVRTAAESQPPYARDARRRELSEGVGDLIGQEQTVIGSGGLGTRGTGLGGGGGMGAAQGAKVAYGTSAPTLQANTEQYTDYGTNAMTATARDHLSTFSIDVDTASYTIARRKLGEGTLPPAASVRVEEFVNYFQYRYQGPTGDAPFAVNLEAAPSPWEPQHHVIRVGVQGKELAAGSRPRRLTFLVDVSGSMQSEDKIGLVKRSLHLLVDQLGPEDSIALVTYAGSTRVVLKATPVTRRADIHDAIEQLTAGGSTAMGSGIGLAYEQASSAYVKGAENRVLVLSDGDANVGPTSHEQILDTIEDYTQQGITLSTFGFGSGNYKDTLMEQIADKGDGNYTYVDSYSEARRAFGEKLSGTLDTIARDVKIQVDFDPDAVLSWRLVGYENRDIADRDFRNDKVDAGEVGSGHSVTALYDVVLSDDALTRGEPLATVRIRAKKPGPDSAAREFETTLTSRAFRDTMGESSQDFRLAVAAASFAEVMRGSQYAQELSYAQVYTLADGAKRKGMQEDRELCELIAQAGRLSGERGPWSGGLAER